MLDVPSSEAAHQREPGVVGDSDEKDEKSHQPRETVDYYTDAGQSEGRNCFMVAIFVRKQDTVGI